MTRKTTYVYYTLYNFIRPLGKEFDKEDKVCISHSLQLRQI
ncbi:hypothetical protein SAMN04488121_1031086 [Chitinophaga filiformis]|uniref:Uncharacterized protein n=1 Tax=Chitinophaga filiformis TaxID=104663 RepID=A0A1G7T0G9_CHIFI|nr:hypothetical protein SAMN04488121_1031086 [Chitinophaga filiformis]